MLKQGVRENLQKKYLQVQRVAEKRQADFKELEKHKAQFAAKKREVNEILAQTHTSGDVSVLHRELEVLRIQKEEMEAKAHQERDEKRAQMLADGQIFTASRPRRAQSMSAGSSSRTTPNVSPQTASIGRERPSSAPRATSAPRPAVAPRPYSARGQPRDRSMAEVDGGPYPAGGDLYSARGGGAYSARGDQRDYGGAPAAGGHYEHLMGLFKARLVASPQHSYVGQNSL